MKQGNKKSTQAEVEKMVELYKNGVSYTEIGRQFGRDHTTIIYWVKKYIKEGKIKVEKQCEKKAGLFIERRGGARVMPKKKIDPDICQWCQKKRREDFDPVWRLTHFCCLKHWDYKMTGVKNMLL